MEREERYEALLIEEADAWFEYLEVTRAELASGRYAEVEPWAWARLNQRLRAVDRKRPASARGGVGRRLLGWGGWKGRSGPLGQSQSGVERT